MTVPEAVRHRRMQIGIAIRMLVMLPMMRRPPQRPALRRRIAEHGKHKLPDAVGLERAMRKITVIERRDREHAQPETGQTNHCRDRTPAHPYQADTSDMQKQKRRTTQPVPPIRTRRINGPMARSGFGIEPVDQGVQVRHLKESRRVPLIRPFKKGPKGLLQTFTQSAGDWITEEKTNAALGVVTINRDPIPAIFLGLIQRGIGFFDHVPEILLWFGHIRLNA